MSEPGLDRTGHLSEYALDRLRFDPADEAFASAATAHLASCQACQHRLLTLARADDALSLSPRSSRPRRSPRPAWLTFIAPLMLAALAFVIARPWSGEGPRSSSPRLVSDDDVRTLKGSPLDLEVFIHDGTRSRPVASGATIHPGERMGFRARTQHDGHLLIVGQDERGQVYGCWPQVADVESASAVPLARTERPEMLPTAMRFDPLLGTETITAIFCPHPFAFSDLVRTPWASAAPRRLAVAAPRGDACLIRTWKLHKREGRAHE